MTLNLDPTAIAETLRRNVESYTPSVEREEVGRVIDTGDGIAREPAPALDLGQVAVAAAEIALALGIDRAAQVAPVGDLMAEAHERGRDARDAQRLRPHRRAAPPGADVRRRAEQRDRQRHAVPLTAGEHADPDVVLAACDGVPGEPSQAALRPRELVPGDPTQREVVVEEGHHEVTSAIQGRATVVRVAMSTLA